MSDSEPNETAAFPFPTKDSHEAPSDVKPVVKTPSEDAIDQGVEETFPASDPISVVADKATKTHK